MHVTSKTSLLELALFLADQLHRYEFVPVETPDGLVIERVPREPDPPINDDAEETR